MLTCAMSCQETRQAKPSGQALQHSKSHYADSSGQEREVIIVSAVRSNEEGRIGFLADVRRLNVALTRARRGLIVIGSRTTLNSNPVWR